MESKAKTAPWIVTEKDPTDGKFIMVHNCYTGKTFRLQKRLAGTPIGEGVSQTWRDFLYVEKLIIEPDKIMPLLEEKLDARMKGFPGNRVAATLIPTYTCQLGCEYCYNDQVRIPTGKKQAEPKTLANKFIRHFSKAPAQFWRMIVTGGGEPILATDYIYKIAKLIDDEAEKKGRDFEIAMVTNGAAFTEKKIAKLVRVGLNAVQVTIDPDHDKTRPYKKGGGSFDDIVANLMKLPMEVSLSVGSNISYGDEKKLPALLKKLEPLRQRIFDLSFVPVLGRVEDKAAPTNGNDVGRVFGEQEIETLMACYAIVDKMGFKRKHRLPRVACETFSVAEHLFLNYAGESYICPGVDNIKEYSEKGKTHEQLRDQFDLQGRNPQWKEFCFTDGVACAYLPKCYGGCRIISVTQGKSWKAINCEKPMFEKLTRHEIVNWTA